ncbi:MAG: T9SS type A sorting domain-containing protein [Bacteroidia bacterium]
MKTNLILTAIFTCLLSLANAQTGWQYLYEPETSIESFVAPAANGDIILVADSYNDTAAFFHRLIVSRLDVQGATKQSTGLFRPPSFRLGSIKGLADGGALLMGTVNIPLEDPDSVFVIKLDDQDQKVWSKGFQIEPDIHVARGAIETADGSYVVYGTYEHVNFAEGIFLLKISPSGNLIWSRTINSQLNGAFMKVGGIAESSTGDFWLLGSTRFNSEGSWLAKLDSIGQTRSVQFLNTHSLTPSQPEPFAIHQRSNGELDLFYNSLAFQNGPVLMAIRTDANGAPQKTTRYYRGGLFGEISAVTPSGDGGYMCAGYTFPSGSNRSAGLAFKIKADYSIDWSRAYSSGYIEILTSIFPSSDGGAVMGGFADFDSVIISPSENGLFPWLVKTNNRGQTSCYDNPVSVTSRDTSVTTMTYQLSNVAGVTLGDIVFNNINVASSPDTVTCAVTSISSPSDLAFHFYPNPSNGTLYIETGNIKPQSMELLTVFGQKQHIETAFSSNGLRIQTSYKGLAIVKVTTVDGVWSGKVLVR